MPPGTFLEAVGLRQNDVVIDVGAGTGFWTEPISRLVGPGGRVIAVDVEPIMLEDLRALVQARDLHNVEVLQSGESSIPLDDAIADLVLLAFVLHEPQDPEDLLGEVVRLLKPHGRVLVLDWQAHPSREGPPLEHRISAEEARALMGAAGLTVEALPSVDNDVYALLGSGFDAREPRAGIPTV